MKLLMHICCAVCAAWPIRALKERGLALTGFWFNPNIEPEDEHSHRLEALKRLESIWGLDVRYAEGYPNALYSDAVRSHAGLRCEACYSLRLMETARQASASGMDAFTTSLLISPYQKHDMVIAAGDRAASAHGVKFHYEDFRPAWRDSQRIARELGLYRQNYCACLASKTERGAERGSRGARQETAREVSIS